MSTGRLTDLEQLRPGFAERAFTLCAPAALAAGLGAFVGAMEAAAAGALGAGLGVLLATFAERRAALARNEVDGARAALAEAARNELRVQLGQLVEEAARTNVEFERRAAFADDARRSQNQLLAELAPEFYGLMRSMGHHAERLRELELDTEDAAAAQGLVDATSSLRRLLGAVLDLARARAGRLRLRERDFDLAAALDRIGRAFTSAARAKGVTFELAIGRLANHWRFGDERRLQQLLERVLGAALDTSERGLIELSVAELPERPDRLRFEVRDGAPIHDQVSFERILTESPGGFENLFELDASLSLALARGLAEVLGGKLEASARTEGGHLIAIELALPGGADPTHVDGPGSADNVGLRALVAAPSGPDGDLVEGVATGLGWLVRRCADATEVDTLLAEEGGADVLLVSTALDAGRGAEHLTRWSRAWPNTSRVLLLDPATRLDARALENSGAALCVTCPPSPARLREWLGEVVSAAVRTPGERLRVLLACEDELGARIEARRLELAGHVVDRVHTHTDLVRAFQDAVYGLVVVDTGGDERVLDEVARLVDADGRSSTGAVKIRALAGGNNRAHAQRGTVPTDTCPSEGSETLARRPTPGAPTVTDPNPRSSIDLDVIQSLRELGGESDTGLLGELVELFNSDTPQRLERLIAAVDSGDFDEAGRVAHSLKSSCGNLGAVVMVELCRSIEHSCRDGSVDGVPSLVRESQSEYERVRTALNQQLG
jgi:HPt (histidine-containing phosphotransfer) domain-containing protein/signal transduction histidine kinase/DNA-binding response OmpR family regulator